MENLNDLIWTDEGNDDGIQPQGEVISLACMAEYCMGALCMEPLGSIFACIRDSYPYSSAGCKY